MNATSYNRAYLASCLRRSAQIPLKGTSDTLGTLGVIAIFIGRKIMTSKEILSKLKSLGSPENIAGMARFGINSKTAYGVRVPDLRKLAKEIGKDHSLALELWQTGIHEARILAGMIDDPKLVSINQAEAWIKDFNSWDVCDQVCMNLFDKTDFAYDKAIEWSKLKNEFEKRAGFALMACLAWHDKKADDSKFIKFFPYIKNGSTDERNFVKKAVNWALRQIGKRNETLRKEAIRLAKEIQKIKSKTAKWIASDALRELNNS